MLNSKIIKIAITTIVLISIFIFGLYAIALNSEPFKVAEKFVRANRPAFFGYSIKYLGASGKAEFEIVTKGKNAKGTVFVSLVRELGVWKFRKANLNLSNGESIALQDNQ